MFKKFMCSIAALALSTSFAASADLSDMSWEAIVAQAKEEGEVTWFNWYFQDRFRETVKSFEDEYGIKVTIPEGTMIGNGNKLIAERERTPGDIDVFAYGFTDYENLDLPSLFMPLDMLPEDDGRVSELTSTDGEGYVLAYWGNQTGIAYDPAKVAADALPQTPQDFERFWTENPEKFGFNYEKGGSGPSYYQNMLRSLTEVDFSDGETSDEKIAALEPGIAFFKSNGANYVVTASNVDSITRVSDGELWMVPAWEDHLAGLQKNGEVRKDIEFYIPEMGMNGGGNGVALPKNAPHPAAAAVFINWLTSAETQSRFNADFGAAPMHAFADDSAALVPNEQRQYSQAWGANPFRKAVEDHFIENVIQER